MTEPCNLLERARARCEDDGGCWTWQGHMNRGCTPVMKDRGRSRAVRRIVYEAACGPVKNGFEVVRTCENPRCCNPEHLKQTPADLRRRELAADRPRPKVIRPGGLNGLAKLSLEKARYIRASDETPTQLAKRFDVSRAAISMVLRGQTWVEPSPFPTPRR
ncbi:HNH endonuclease [Variovorax sp. DAIF25]|uniref:HNH endonuclease n=1 Tax=Variovorax sp. DAIF25 TaxID=3080983 RepID=UPI003D6AD83C